MKLTIKHKQIGILTLLLVMLVVILMLVGCGTSGKNCIAPADSSVTVTGAGSFVGLAADTGVNYTVVVKYSDGSVMPKACVNISGSLAAPRNPGGIAARYQFYFFPNGTNDPNNAAVNSGFDAQTDDFGAYTFSAMITAGSGTFTDTITVISGSNIGTATISVQ